MKQADCINIEEITTNKRNQELLCRLKIDSVYFPTRHVFIQNHHDDKYHDSYVPHGAFDMKWLGYFIGENTSVTELNFNSFTPTSRESVAEVLEAFIRGVNSNKSITDLSFDCMDSMYLLGGRVFSLLTPFFENMRSMSNILIRDCNLGDDGWKLLALAIGSSNDSPFNSLLLQNNNISDKSLVNIITALSKHPHLKEMDLSGNGLGKNGCIALSTLLQNSVTGLLKLDLANNEIDDEGINTLLSALKNCRHLHTMVLSQNDRVTIKGLQCLASVLESPNSSLKILAAAMAKTYTTDEMATVFFNPLANNHKLEYLFINASGGFGDKFGRLIWDKSNVNSTFLSNHIIQYIGPPSNMSGNGWHCKINKRENKEEVAMIKILSCNRNFDMSSFFEWEFKVLPLMINWFERADITGHPRLEPRILSAIYQFVRGMPLLYIEARLRKEVEDMKVAETQMEEEQDELIEKLLDLETKHQLSQKRKRSIMERLDQRL